MITEKVCFTSRPPITDYLPLPDGRADVFMRKNIEQAETEYGIVYYADEAYMRITDGEPSQAEVITDFDDWFAAASEWEAPLPTPTTTPEERIAALEAENINLKAQLENTMQALDSIIMGG